MTGEFWYDFFLCAGCFFSSISFIVQRGSLSHLLLWYLKCNDFVLLFEMFWRCKSRQWKTFPLVWFPFDGLQKTKLKKWWQALQVNLGHFIKNMRHNKESETQSFSRGHLLSHNGVNVLILFNCRNYASSAFQHRENISKRAYETVLCSRCCIVAQVYLKKSVKRKYQFYQRQKENPAFQLSLPEKI